VLLVHTVGVYHTLLCVIAVEKKDIPSPKSLISFNLQLKSHIRGLFILSQHALTSVFHCLCSFTLQYVIVEEKKEKKPEKVVLVEEKKEKKDDKKVGCRKQRRIDGQCRWQCVVSARGVTPLAETTHG
jgi:hypothetical protein